MSSFTFKDAAIAGKQLYELKGDSNKYTLIEANAAEYVAESIPTPVEESALQTAGTVTIDGVTYTYTPASSRR